MNALSQPPIQPSLWLRAIPHHFCTDLEHRLHRGTLWHAPCAAFVVSVRALCTVIAVFCVAGSGPARRSHTVTALLYQVPPCTALMAWTLFGEMMMSLLTLVGTVLRLLACCWWCAHQRTAKCLDCVSALKLCPRQAKNAWCVT